ncbi:unnamed protein product, partial [marine sediment metagenome]
LIKEVQTQKADAHRATYSRIVDKAQKQVLSTLSDATAAQANIIAATATDKVRLLDNQPTSIRGDSDSVKSLAAQFDKLALDHKRIQNSVVSTQEGSQAKKG